MGLGLQIRVGAGTEVLHGKTKVIDNPARDKNVQVAYAAYDASTD